VTREPRSDSALPLTHQWVKDLADQNGHWQERVLWDEQTKRVRAERVLQLGALELERQALQQPSCEQSRDVLIKQLSKDGISALPWSQRTEQLRSRLALAHQRLGSPVAATHSPTPGKASQHLDWRHFDGLQKLGRRQGRATDRSPLG
jgi:ATP-dependent helicase HrpB